MTDQEAREVARIACRADGGDCYICARDLLLHLQETFPDHAPVFEEVFVATFVDDSWGDGPYLVRATP